MLELKKTLTITLFSLIFLLLALLGIFFLVRERNLEESKKTSSFSLRSISPTQSSIAVNPEQGVIILKKIDDLTYHILASSENSDIVGFDLIVETKEKTDSLSLTFSSLLPSFSLSQIKEENFFILTGFKKINIKEPAIFNETPIVEIKLTTPIAVNLKTEWKKYTSKMVDNQNNVLKPKIILK